MKKNSPILPDRIAFIADAHLGLPGDNSSRPGIIADFLRNIRGKISHLYIVGDLFDFWFEYTSVVPNTAPEVIFELYNLVMSGTDIYLFAGNHDYWQGSYLSDHVGVNIIPDSYIAEHQGKRIYLHHGDGLYPHDTGYRILKKVLRNKISIFLFGLLHPDVAAKIARLTSKTSRDYLSHPDFEKQNLELFRVIGDKRLEEHFDAAVYGHCHVPLVEQRENGILVLLGEWLKYNTYVILEEGVFTLHSWKPSKEHENG